MTAAELRAEAQRFRESAIAIRKDAQYTDSSEARSRQEDLARRADQDALRLEVQANAIDAKTLEEIRAVLTRYETTTHMSKHQALEQIRRLAGHG